MELQLEEDYEERQSVLREKRDLERRIQELMDKPLQGDKDAEKRLRRDLKKTKALFKDVMQDRQNAAAPSGAKLKQLKNEVCIMTMMMMKMVMVMVRMMIMRIYAENDNDRTLRKHLKKIKAL